ncbi:protein-glutamate O-methyltransferase CheR [uncultured Thiodictyon sp.]|jgi:chemotaxis protein methyltransferase WspC|uniref:CheR family methyltransferase n=1 Tax=uncultured Thiodictyon sp. TaxID=1846217 RepID=UPI0025FDE5A7|nr:protein-glutamate O-methyltransferase CheR [uncultured Thiodictyon sp.]
MTDASDPRVVGETLRAWIRGRTGISITEQNQAPVELAVRLEAERHGLDPVIYLNRLQGGVLPPQAFIDAITTNESYFFRAQDQMRVTITRLIPELMRCRPAQPARILSLPCARGEEPYSLAILCEEHRIPPRAVELVAGDISATCLADARRGDYGPLALRRTDPTTAQHWFTPRGPRTYRLEPALLGRVSFYQVNLLEDAAAVLARRFDVIFCENLLIYFDAETTSRALAVLGRLLEPDGWLFVDHAEWNIPREQFRMQELDGCVGFRPTGAATPARAGQPRAGAVRGATAPAPGARMPAGDDSLPSVHQTPTPLPRPTHSPARSVTVAPSAPAPLIGDPRLAHAEAHYKAKRFAEALRTFDVVLVSRPADARARLGKARVLADCGEDFEALEVAEALLHAVDEGELRLSPADYVEALALIALLLHKKGLKDLAQGYLREIARRAPGHPSLGLLRPGPDHA